MTIDCGNNATAVLISMTLFAVMWAAIASWQVQQLRRAAEADRQVTLQRANAAPVSVQGPRRRNAAHEVAAAGPGCNRGRR